VIEGDRVRSIIKAYEEEQGMTSRLAHPDKPKPTTPSK